MASSSFRYLVCEEQSDFKRLNMIPHLTNQKLLTTPIASEFYLRMVKRLSVIRCADSQFVRASLHSLREFTAACLSRHKWMNVLRGTLLTQCGENSNDLSTKWLII